MDCLEGLKQIPDNSVDAIVTDPPYELGFMGKKWDASGIAYNLDLWKEVLRILKPGGHLLAFGGTRTYHRMAVAIEDAGFEVRDMLEWIYASGFPKSLNIGKAVDKLQGNERKVIGEKEYKPGWHKEHTQNDDSWTGAEDKGLNITKGTSEWEGWGTALKPAHEPICMARKPLECKTIVGNVLKLGTGAIDIDGCRIPTSESWKQQAHDIRNNGLLAKKGRHPNLILESNMLGRFPANIICTDDALNDGVMTKSTSGKKNPNGKYHGVNSEVYGEWKPQPDKIQGIDDSGSKSRYFDIDVWAEKHGLLQFPKASKRERNEGCEELEKKENCVTNQSWKCGVCGKFQLQGNGDVCKCENPDWRKPSSKNHHPTVKPVHLMSWLVRLVSKEGDIVLDPFSGSGTTGVSCRKQNRNFIGFEREEEYCKIANARLNANIEIKEKPKQDTNSKIQTAIITKPKESENTLFEYL